MSNQDACGDEAGQALPQVTAGCDGWCSDAHSAAIDQSWGAEEQVTHTYTEQAAWAGSSGICNGLVVYMSHF